MLGKKVFQTVLGLLASSFIVLFAAFSASATTVGTEWNSATIPGSLNTANFLSVAYGDGHWVAVSSSGDTAISTDGQTWAAGGNTGAFGRSITFGGGKFVVVDGNYSAVSTDNGVTWTRGTDSSDYYYAVAYGNGHFVKTENDNCPGLISWSTDGLTWNDVTVSNVCWYDVTYGNGKFVAIGSGHIATSSDGVTWATASSSSNAFSIAFGNSLFMTVSNSPSNVYTSPDGVNWTTHALTGAIAQAWSSISFGGGTWLLSTANTSYSGVTQTMATSVDDGITWLGQPLNGYQWNDAEYGNGEFVAVGQFIGSTPPSGRTDSSIAWTGGSSPSPTPSPSPSQLAETGNSGFGFLFFLLGTSITVGLGLLLIKRSFSRSN